jgi:pyridoxine 5'-phosphate synthase PdxJ
MDVQVIIGYKGMLDLARRSGQINSISAREVCENDEFSYQYGLREDLTHKPAMRQRGDVIGFYAVAHLSGGGHQFEFMSREQVEEIRDNSQGYKAALSAAKRYNKTPDTPWETAFVEMGKKTALRRLFKYLPVSIEMLAKAMELEDSERTGVNHGEVITGEYSTVEDSAALLQEIAVFQFHGLGQHFNADRQVFEQAAQGRFFAHFDKRGFPWGVWGLVVALGGGQRCFVALRVVADFFDLFTRHELKLMPAAAKVRHGIKTDDIPALSHCRLMRQVFTQAVLVTEFVVLAHFACADAVDLPAAPGQVKHAFVADNHLNVHPCFFSFSMRFFIIRKLYSSLQFSSPSVTIVTSTLSPSAACALIFAMPIPMAS